MVKHSFVNFILFVADMKITKKAAGWLNQIKFPYQHFPVRVNRVKLVAASFDRFLVLWLWKLKLLESDEISLIHELCKPGMAVLDIGANIGFHTLNLSTAVGKSGHIWAFEPDTRNFECLKTAIRLNQIENVTVEKFAIGDITETGALYLSRSNSGNHSLNHPPAGSDFSNPTVVKVIKLDDYFPADQKIDFIKMDIQGSEGLAIRGMQDLLLRNAQITILFEFWPKGLAEAGSNPLLLLIDLCEMGFVLFEIGSKGRLAVSDIRAFVESLRQNQYVNLLAVRR